MENKIATYTEPNGERLQLLRVISEDGSFVFEIRANRILVSRFSSDQGLHARLVFYHCLHEILVNRSHALLKIT